MAFTPLRLGAVALMFIYGAGVVASAPPAAAVGVPATCGLNAGVLTVQMIGTGAVTISNAGGRATVTSPDAAGPFTCQFDTSSAYRIFLQNDPMADFDRSWTLDLSTPFTSTQPGNALAEVVVLTHDYDPVSVNSPGSSAPQIRRYEAANGGNHFSLDGNDSIDLNLKKTVPLTIRTGGGNDVLDMRGLTTPITLDSGGGADTVTGGNADDSLLAGAGNDTVRGGPGSDTIVDDAGQDTYIGGTGAADDMATDYLTLYADGASDVVNPGSSGGQDELLYDVADDVEASIDGVANDGPDGDNLRGIATLTTGSGNDVVHAAGLNTVSTGPGDDRLIDGGGGADVTWDGGGGSDLLDLSHDTVAAVGSLGASSGMFGAGRPINAFHVEAILGTPQNDQFQVGCACRVQPGPGNDSITLSGDGATFVADATSDGNDTVVGPMDSDTAVTTADYSMRSAGVTVSLDDAANDGGTGESDDIDSGVRNLIGGTGADTLTGSVDGNVLRGGAGNDALSGRGGVDVLMGGGGADSLSGGSAADRLYGEDGSDRLWGGDGDDRLVGDIRTSLAAGNDALDGGAGDDDEFGYGGDDTFSEGSSSNGSDLLSGGAGTDTASYSGRATALNLTLDGRYNDGASGEGDDVAMDVENLVGGRGSDHLTGDAVSNKITGGSGRDVLSGLGGNDNLISLDSLVDSLNGGTGTDKAHRDSIDRVTSVEQRY